MTMNLFQACLKADEKAAANLVTEMMGTAHPSAIWAIFMHAASWHEQTEFDTPHSTIMTHSIHKMVEEFGPNSKVLESQPSKTLVEVPPELKELLQESLLQRLARYLAAVDHWAPEKGPKYDVPTHVDSLDNVLRAYTQAVREHSHMGALNEAVILADRDEPIRLIRRSVSLAAEAPDSLGHGFIMPVSLLLELPERKFKLPHKAVIWHLTEYMTRKVPSKKPDALIAEDRFKQMAEPTDIKTHRNLFKDAVVNYGVLGHNGIFAQRISEAARLGLVSSTTIDWLLKKLEKNISSKTRESVGVDWDEHPSKVGLPYSKKLRTWLQENVPYYDMMMDLDASAFESEITSIPEKHWPTVRAAQYAMSAINGAPGASHVIIFAQAVWSLTDTGLIDKAVAALQVHRMLRQYLKGR